ncbi:FAD-dependent oxidoreductase [Candidatus Riflebacteria bacterium]
MEKEWICIVCGYVHQGDEPPGMCPVCGVGPEEFEEFQKPAGRPEGEKVIWRCSVCDYSCSGKAPPGQCPTCDANVDYFKPAEESTSGEKGIGHHIVIVGNGIAGFKAAEAARQQSDTSRISLLSREANAPYYRLNLTRFLAGELPAEELGLKPDKWYEEKRIVLIDGEVKEIRRDSRTLHLEDGRDISYDRLILTCGAQAFRPPIPGQQLGNVFCLRTLRDAQELIKSCQSAKYAVVIGGGLLGLEGAAALQKQGLKTTVLEGFDYLLPRQFVAPASQLLEAALKKKGLTIRCGVKIVEITGRGHCEGVKISDQETIPADLVLLSTGIRPETHLARKCGLEVNKGLLVSDKMATNDPAIFAAGDMIEFQDRLYGIWPAAYAQGMVAGINAVGGEVVYNPLPQSTRLKVTGLDLFSLGQFNPPDGSFAVFQKRDGDNFYWLVSRDGYLTGANLFGDTSLASTLSEGMEKNLPIHKIDRIIEKFPELKSR